MSVLSRLSENKGAVFGILALIVFAHILYIRVIRDNAIYEEFSGSSKCLPQLGMVPGISAQTGSNLVSSGWNGQVVNKDSQKCSNYVLNSPPIASMFNINDMCHTNCPTEQLHWDCFYRYDLEKKFLEDPNWAKDAFPINYAIFYKV